MKMGEKTVRQIKEMTREERREYALWMAEVFKKNEERNKLEGL